MHRLAIALGTVLAAACAQGRPDLGDDVAGDDDPVGDATVTVTLAGDGVGAVTSTPTGIACGAACTATYPRGTTVTLAAAPEDGSTFAGWSGACSGGGACAVTANGAHAVTATFARARFGLTVTRAGAGTGTVTSSPAGIDCGADCAEEYLAGTAVTLTATPAAGSSFAGWSGGGCAGAGPCTVTMTQAHAVTATFAVVVAVAWSEAFTSGVAASAQCTSWDTFRAGLTGDFTSVRISGTFDQAGVTCSDPVIATQLATALRTNGQVHVACGGRTWSLCARYSGELWLDPPGLCDVNNCPTGYILRPCIGPANPNWGGVNTATCNAPTQTMTLTFTR